MEARLDPSKTHNRSWLVDTHRESCSPVFSHFVSNIITFPRTLVSSLTFVRKIGRGRRGISRLVTSIVIVALLAISAAVAYYYYLSSSSNNAGIGTTTPMTTSASVDTSTTNTFPSETRSNQTTQIPCGGATWSTYHCDNSRDGVDGNESNLNSPTLAWQSPTLDGAIYAEPLIAFGKVFVVTENDSFYALNATNGNILWRTHVGTPVPLSDLPCGDIDPLGITGTPVLDLSNRVLYAVAEVTGGAHFLYGVNIDSGAIVFSRNVDPPGSNPKDQQQRPALSLDRGIVYVELGGLDGDCGVYHGWVVGVQLNDSSKPLYAFEVAPNASDYQGGIWEVGGASIAPNGNLYIATGNTQSSTYFDYGDGVIELSPTLQLLSYFAPGDYQSLNTGDTDLGSTGPILMNNLGLVFQIGKEGVGYLLNENNLGGYNNSVYSAQVCSSAYSADAYYNSVIYVPCSDGLHALMLQGQGSSATFSIAWTDGAFRCGAPIVSGNAVWVIDLDNATLLALNPTTGVTIYGYQLNSPVTFETPASADGMIFAAGNNQITAIQL